jgi:hypothetical protein
VASHDCLHAWLLKSFICAALALHNNQNEPH